MMIKYSGMYSDNKGYKKEKKMTAAGLMIVMLMSGAQLALAHGDAHHHMDGDMHGMAMNSGMGQMKGGFLTSKEVDGYTVSFHIMKAAAGMVKGGSHSVMIKVEHDGQVLTDLMANSKVVHPNGESESKMLMRMGDWYMASYDLGHPGKHQVMVLFKTDDGAKHFVGVEYAGKSSGS